VFTLKINSFFFASEDGNNDMNSQDNKNKNYPPQRNPRRKGSGPTRNDDELNWNKILKVILGWSAIIMAVFFIMTFLKSSEGSEYRITFPQYEFLLNNTKIEKAVIKKSDFNNVDFHGILKQREILKIDGKEVAVERFMVLLPFLDNEIVKNWTEKNISFVIEKEDNLWINALINMLPWILLIVIWFVFMRRLQGGGNKGIFSFGKSRAKLIGENTQKVNFTDVAGADEAKVELQEVIES
jgi:cell division protease FtsH